MDVMIGSYATGAVVLAVVMGVVHLSVAPADRLPWWAMALIAIGWPVVLVAACITISVLCWVSPMLDVPEGE